MVDMNLGPDCVDHKSTELRPSNESVAMSPQQTIPARRRSFLAGLFFITLSTLALEILNTRLLSVLTWYHISFFAVSTAMFGMSAGAVRVYLSGERLRGANAVKALVDYGWLYTISIPCCHVINLCVPIVQDYAVNFLAALVLTTLALSIPFYLSGIVVTIALTRIPGRIGLTYSADMIGAALGCLVVMLFLEWSNISSATAFIAACSGIGVLLFQRFAGVRRQLTALCLIMTIVLLGYLNSGTSNGLRVQFSKGRVRRSQLIQHEAWNIHSQVIAQRPRKGKPFYWGPGPGAGAYEVETVWMVIDGDAGTAMTRWDGDRASLDWVRHDVTSLPYHLYKDKDVAIIGVGGGRDILTALWAGSGSVTGIEINDVFIELLEGSLSDFANLADRPDVELVHDEARSYLTRTDQRFDIIQMSLIDTWAATGAGAFTLTENGLYTREAWRVFLHALNPGGVFSVSRWFTEGRLYETTRLLALATAALLDFGVEDPSNHLVLATCKNVVTLLVALSPFERDDLAEIESVCRDHGFELVVAPGQRGNHPLLELIVNSRSLAGIDDVVRDEPFDYSPPTDQQPYFFNQLKPGHLWAGLQGAGAGIIGQGNLLATLTLGALGIIAMALVIAVIAVPLVRSGLPNMPRGSFVHAIAYFALIGLGFMMVQIPAMQRFSIYLGHPTYSVAVILFSMILFAGLGSWISDRIRLERGASLPCMIPLAAALLIFMVTLATQTVIDATVQHWIVVRCAVVVSLIGPVSFLLGFCFPIGMRLVKRIADDAMPWMWGVNGACGVFSSVLAVEVSIWSGISTSLFLATILYALLPLSAWALWRRGASPAGVEGYRRDDATHGERESDLALHEDPGSFG